MSWRGDTRGIIRRYPEYTARLNDLRSASMTANYSAEPRGGGDASRTTENLALLQLPRNEQREHDAVEFAIKCTRCNYPRDYQDRMRVVELLYWGRDKHNMETVAPLIPCSIDTVKRYNSAFLQLVDACMMVLSARW